MRISFDYDSCLAEDRQQRVAKRLIDAGHEIWITTTRTQHPPIQSDWDNKILFKVAEKLGILPERIQFTSGKDKWEFLQNFDLHFDDDQIEVELIEENTKCLCVLIFDP